MLKKQTGYVYFFKYKMSKDDNWKIGISGIQPASLNRYNTNNDLTRMTGKRLTDNRPLLAQYEEELRNYCLLCTGVPATFLVPTYTLVSWMIFLMITERLLI